MPWLFHLAFGGLLVRGLGLQLGLVFSGYLGWRLVVGEHGYRCESKGTGDQRNKQLVHEYILSSDGPGVRIIFRRVAERKPVGGQGRRDLTKPNDYIDFCCRLQRDHRCLNSLVASVQRRFNTWSCLPSVRCQPWALPRSLARCLPWVLSQSWARHRRWSSLRSWAPAWQPCVSSAWLSSAQPWSHRLSWLPGRRR